jgi:AcrR family transcriptional regulator
LPSSQRQKQKDKTRQHLIEVAFIQLAKDGLIATRTADIAQAAGVSHGTIFAHFPTRDDLLTAVIETFGSRITDRLHQLVSSEVNLKAVLEAHLQGLEEFEPFYTRLVIEGRLLPESARNTLITIQSAISFHMSQAAEVEMKAGTIRPFPIYLLFNTWIGLIHYYLANNDLFAPGDSVLRRKGPELLEYFLQLITSEGGSR